MGVLRNWLKSPSNQPLQQIRNRVPELIYKLRDDFITPLLPGAVNGTSAEPGPGTRTVVDTTNVLAITNGKLTINGINAAGDPGLWWNAKPRQAGLIFSGNVKVNDATQICEFGWDTNQAGALAANCYRISADTLLIYDSGAAGPSVYVPVDITEYKFAIVLRATGAYYFWNDGGYWELLWISATNNTATVYPSFSNNSVLAGELWNIALPAQLWLPKPLLSDGFVGTNEPDAVDYGGVNDGDYVRVGLGGDSRKAFFDGTNSYCNIYSADLNNKFDGKECSVIVRGKVSAAAVWNDGTNRYMVRIQVDANNNVYIRKTTILNQLRFDYDAGGVSTTFNDVSLAGTINWFTVGITGSDSDNQMRGYLNGVESAGSPIANAGVFTGNLDPFIVLLGSASAAAPSLLWDGWLSDAIVLYGVVATPTQMSDIHTHLDAGTLTEQILDTEFGVNNWSWWKLNEQFDSDGLGHAEGIAGGIGSGGAERKYLQPSGAFDYVSNSLHTAFVEANAGLGVLSGLAAMIADCKTADILITAELTISNDGCGVIARYTDENNYIFAFYNDFLGAATVYLTEVVGGVANNILAVAAVYGAGNPIRLILDGLNARLYYNDVLIGTGVIDSNLPSSTWHGAGSIYVNETIDNLTIYARGTGGEYELLEAF